MSSLPAIFFPRGQRESLRYCQRSLMCDASYILPLKTAEPCSSEFARYLSWLSDHIEVIVVDGSSAAIFELHDARFGLLCRHIPVDEDLITSNGKVGAVLTGTR